MKCPFCHQELPDDSRFCTACGKKIPRCPTCGKVIETWSRFCTNDGSPLPDELLADFEAPPETPDDGHFRMMDQSLYTPPEPPKKKGRAGLIIILIAAAVVAAAAVALGVFVLINHRLPFQSGGSRGSAGISAKETTPFEQIMPDSPETPASGTETQPDSAETPASGTETQPDSAETPASGTQNQPTPPETPQSAPETEPSPPETQPPVTIEHTYEIIAGDVTWEEAKRACEERGGHLATVTSPEEYETVSGLASQHDLTFLWLGACLESDSDAWGETAWITGEPWSFEKWYPGEPSLTDADGTKESYLCLWNVAYDGQDIGWTFNDQRNNIIEAVSYAQGQIGYVCEYENEVSR